MLSVTTNRATTTTILSFYHYKFLWYFCSIWFKPYNPVRVFILNIFSLDIIFAFFSICLSPFPWFGFRLLRHNWILDNFSLTVYLPKLVSLTFVNLYCHEERILYNFSSLHPESSLTFAMVSCRFIRFTSKSNHPKCKTTPSQACQIHARSNSGQAESTPSLLLAKSSMSNKLNPRQVYSSPSQNHA